MANRLAKWLAGRQNGKETIRLEDVKPLHPTEYPARRLKAMLDDRRGWMEEVVSHPTGMVDDLGHLT